MNNDFSTIQFSIFSPETFQLRVKNNIVINKPTSNNIATINSTINDSSKNLVPDYNNNIRSTNYRTSSIQNKPTKKIILFRDIVTKTPEKPKKKKYIKAKYSLTQGKIEPYKQYILEKRELENIKKRREIEKKYIIESKLQQDLKLLGDIKSKYEGYDFSKQQNKVGYLDKYLESKNYSKEKIKGFPRPSTAYRKNKYEYIDMDLLQDLKSNKKRNVFEEDFDIKNLTKYNIFRTSLVSFIKSLRSNQNYNYWIGK